MTGQGLTGLKLELEVWSTLCDRTEARSLVLLYVTGLKLEVWSTLCDRTEARSLVYSM